MLEEETDEYEADKDAEKEILEKAEKEKKDEK